MDYSASLEIETKLLTWLYLNKTRAVDEQDTKQLEEEDVILEIAKDSQQEQAQQKLDKYYQQLSDCRMREWG